ncbi:LysM peptidoglycan-binding domain-containing protein, partial [Streptococcus anginosus]|uniref:LysM peptidoglycan-binding domain-containing protein n=1 Tax=Streptococcus anginosus TaxID=1328 RepID=UPI0021F84826
LSSNLIYPGQVLYAGANSSSPAKANTSSPVRPSSPAAKPAQSAKQSYRVQAGDGLWTVAKNLGTTIEAVKAANGLTSNFIYPGQVLYAPGQTQSASSPAGTSTTSNQQSQGQSHAGY